MKRIAKEGLVVGLGQALVVLGRFVTVWWLTRLLDPGAFGQVALVQGIAGLGFFFLCGPLLQAGLRFHSEAAGDGRAGALHGLLRPLISRAAWLTAGILVVGALVWKTATGAPVTALALATGLIAVVPDTFRIYATNRFNAARRHAAYVTWNVADALARPCGAAAAIAWLGRTPEAALLGFATAAVAVNLACARLFGEERPERAEAEWTRQTRSRLFRFAIPLVPLAIMPWIVGTADRYVLAGTSGAAAAGLYAAIYGVGSQGFIALSLFGLTVFRPPFFTAVDAGDARKSRRVFAAWLAALAAGSALGVGALALLAAPITRLCLGPEFQVAAPLLPWIGAAYVLYAVQTALEALLYARHKTGNLLWIQTAGAGTAAVLYAILIPRYGGWGAAIATLCSFAVSSVLAAVYGELVATLRSGVTSSPRGAATR